MGAKDKDDKVVMVVDKNGICLDLTRPAKVRKLIDLDKAVLISSQPPIIKLKKSVRRIKMDIRKINEYFDKNREVFVQNISGGVVSLSFYHPDGRIEPFSLPNDRRPICLTNWITKDLIRNSVDFRRLLMRKPPAIRLLSENEYSELIHKVARETGKSVVDVESDIAEKITNRGGYVVPSSGEDLGLKVEPPPSSMAAELSAKAEVAPKSDEVVPKSDEVVPKKADIDVPGIADVGINPRVLQIVANCSESAENRIKAQDAIAELALLNLTDIDLNYIIGNCAYKTVRAWAQKKLSEVNKK